MKLRDIIEGQLEVYISPTTATDLVREIQVRLIKLGFKPGDIDGIAGRRTMEALAKFKESRYLGQPFAVGPTTARALLEENHPISEQRTASDQKLLTPDTIATGKQFRLVSGDTVGEFDEIRTGSFLHWNELFHGWTRIPARAEYIENAYRLADTFAWIRKRYDKPIAITSGYRDEDTNRSVGGSRFSQHLYCKALDIQPLNGKSNDLKEIFLLARACPSVIGLGLGMCQGFVHIDIRDGGRTVFGYGC